MKTFVNRDNKKSSKSNKFFFGGTSNHKVPFFRKVDNTIQLKEKKEILIERKIKIDIKSKNFNNLYRIGIHFGIPWKEIAKYNKSKNEDFDANRLRNGDIIYLPNNSITRNKFPTNLQDENLTEKVLKESNKAFVPISTDVVDFNLPISTPEVEEIKYDRCQIIEFNSSQLTGKKLLIDKEFLASAKKINKLLIKYNIKLDIIQGVRIQGSTVTGAIVTPAKKSNHLAGHAIDMNIIHSGNSYNSSKLKNSNFKNLPADIQNFISGIRIDSTLRWGGDFNDPVHIDDGLNIKNPQLWKERFKIIQDELSKGKCPK